MHIFPVDFRLLFFYRLCKGGYYVGISRNFLLSDLQMFFPLRASFGFCYHPFSLDFRLPCIFHSFASLHQFCTNFFPNHFVYRFVGWTFSRRYSSQNAIRKGAHARVLSYCIGNCTKKVLTPVSVLSAQIFPLCASTIVSAIDNPSP